MSDEVAGVSGSSLGAPADVIGGARITGRLGEGTLAEVFAGEQLSLGRPVAVKILKPSITPTSKLGRQFAREAQLLARLVHQGLPQVFDAGECGSRPFLVMERVEGVTLQSLLREHGTLPIDVATIIALQIARALECLHRVDVVHRDVKPANVLVGFRGDTKLMDLGIARDLAGESDGLGVVGTPAYMSPEQVLGDALDARSDLFSFGILFYEMLVGRRPFEDDPSRTAMQKIRLDRYTRPRTLRRDVPVALERILARTLEKNPAHRYLSTGALVNDLAEHLARTDLVAREARVVAYLAACGHAGAVEVQRQLGRAGLAVGDAPVRTHRRGYVLGQAACGLAALLATLALGDVRGRNTDTAGNVPLGPRAAGTGDVGWLRVVARPWAQVSIDGVAVDTTPVAEPFRLAPGVHFVRLANPSFTQVDRTVRIERGSTVWLDVDLAPPTAGTP